MESFVKSLEKNTTSNIAKIKQDFSGIRANRPTSQLVENVVVEYAGASLPIKQLAAITVSPPRDIQITAWDAQSVGAIAKAIEQSKTGLTPQIEGSVIRLKLPALSYERRQELIKLSKSMAEKEKIKIRSFRDSINKSIDKAFSEKAITEDQKFKEKKNVQEHIEKINKEIDDLLDKKIKEIES